MLPISAVVSVKPDYPPSAVQAATGQPLLAQSANPGYMFLQHQVMPPQPTGYQMGQVSLTWFHQGCKFSGLYRISGF